MVLFSKIIRIVVRTCLYEIRVALGDQAGRFQGDLPFSLKFEKFIRFEE
jgi:hypothetical protein